MMLNKHLKILYIGRILSGQIRLYCRDNNNNIEECFIVSPSISDIAIACEECYDTYQKHANEDIMTDEQMLTYMLENNLWTLSQNDRLTNLPSLIENIKIELYNSYFKSKRQETLRRELRLLKKEYAELSQQRYYYNDSTLEGLAEAHYTSTLLSRRLRDKNMNRYQYISLSFLESVIYNYYLSIIPDEHIRFMAHNEPWKTYWSASKIDNKLFNIPTICLDDNQKSIILWSKLYDNIYENPECPSNDIIDDDDMLDGWLLIQNKKQIEERGQQNKVVDIKNTKPNARQEIFVPAETLQDAQKIDRLNDTTAKFIKKQRFEQLKQKGTVKEEHMQDSQMEIRTMAQKMYSERFKNGK